MRRYLADDAHEEVWENIDSRLELKAKETATAHSIYTLSANKGPVRLILALLATAIISTFSIGSALATEVQTFKYRNGMDFDEKHKYWVDDNQDVTMHFRLRPSGAAVFWSRYSNGKRFDGDHFYAKVSLIDRLGRTIVQSNAGVGLNATYGRGTQVAFREIPFSVESEYRNQIVEIRFETGHSDGVK